MGRSVREKVVWWSEGSQAVAPRKAYVHTSRIRIPCPDIILEPFLPGFEPCSITLLMLKSSLGSVFPSEYMRDLLNSIVPSDRSIRLMVQCILSTSSSRLSNICPLFPIPLTTLLVQICTNPPTSARPNSHFSPWFSVRLCDCACMPHQAQCTVKAARGSICASLVCTEHVDNFT